MGKCFHLHYLLDCHADQVQMSTDVPKTGKYSYNLNNRLVRYANGPKLPDSQTVLYSEQYTNQEWAFFLTIFHHASHKKKHEKVWGRSILVNYRDGFNTVHKDVWVCMGIFKNLHREAQAMAPAHLVLIEMCKK